MTGQWRDGANGRELVFETDAPAFYVTIGLGEHMVYNDNAFTLRPGQPKILRALYRADDRSLPIDATERVSSIQHLTSASAAAEHGKLVQGTAN